MSKQEKKLAGAMRIFEALSGVDEELLVRCEEAQGSNDINTSFVKKARPIWYYGKVLAACLCFVVMGVLLWSVRPMMKSAMDLSGSVEMAPAPAQEAFPAASAMEENTSLEEAALEGCPEESLNGEETEKDGGMNAVAQENQVNDRETVKQESAKTESAIQDLQGSASGIQESVNEDKQTGCATSAPLDRRKEISLEDARMLEVLGVYVPDTSPAGYDFEGAWLTENTVTQEAERMSLCWTRGMDDIRISVSFAAAGTAVVDISRPETYNVHKYEIPYGTTVPEEYHTVFNNPVFAEEDFTLEMVEARMKSVSDAGDTDTPRGNFAVLYDSGVLVEFSGNGDAKSIYEMLVVMQ